MSSENLIPAYESKATVAKRLQLTVRCLDDWKRDPKNTFPKPIRIGKFDRYDRAEVLAFIAERRAAAKKAA